MKRCLALAFLLLLTHSTALLADTSKREGKDLIENSETKSNIFDLPSFEMKANIRIENKGKPLDGSYLLLWNGAEQWREEISLPGYSETDVGGKGVVFLTRNMDFIPLQIEQLRWALGYGRAPLAPGPKEAIEQIHGRKVNGLKVECAEIVDQEKHTREVCVDESTGALVRQNPFFDGELMPVGTKLFPRLLSYVGYGKSRAEVQVTELKTTEQLPSSAFEPPAGAVSKPGCWNPTPAHLVKRVNPSSPESERQSRVEGTVAIYALIATDGVPRDLRIVSGVTPGLNKASLDAVQQWRYDPITCNGAAVEFETVILVNYQLSPHF